MKTKENKRITLKRFTIAKINQNTLAKIIGGDCDVTEPDAGSHWTMCECDNPF